MVIRPTKKTTFYTPDKHLKIYDFRGVIFYDSKWVKNFKGYLTLPKGTFNTENKMFTVFKEKNNYEIKLPKRERDLKHDFSKFRIKFESNPNKCTIFHKKNLIVYDTSFKKAPWFQLVFILMHEKGHNYYKSEDLADLYAVRAMLRKGYTPIQICLAPLLTLSGEAYNRKKHVVSQMIKSMTKKRKI